MYARTQQGASAAATGPLDLKGAHLVYTKHNQNLKLLCRNAQEAAEILFIPADESSARLLKKLWENVMVYKGTAALVLS